MNIQVFICLNEMKHTEMHMQYHAIETMTFLTVCDYQ